MRMDKIPGRNSIMAILSITLAGLLLLTACTPDTTPPTGKEKVVEFGIITPVTGPYAASEQIGLSGRMDYTKYFNEEMAIPGVTIKARWSDSGGQIAPGISAYRRFVERGINIMCGSEVRTFDALKSSFEKDQVVFLTPSPVESLLYPVFPWIYSSAPTWGEQFAVLADHIMENWKEQRPPKLAFIIFDNPWGWEPAHTGMKYAESIGIETLPIEIVPVVPLDVTPNLLRLSARGADFVYIQNIQPGAMVILKDAGRLGLIDKIQFCGCWASTGEAMLQATGTLSEGYLLPRDMPTPDETEIPGVQMLVDIMMKYQGRIINAAEYGSCKDTAIAYEAIRRAIENVGYENLDGQAIKKEIDSIKDLHIVTGVTITYTPEDHRGSDKAAIYEVINGKIVRVSDWLTAPMLMPTN